MSIFNQSPSNYICHFKCNNIRRYHPHLSSFKSASIEKYNMQKKKKNKKKEPGFFSSKSHDLSTGFETNTAGYFQVLLLDSYVYIFVL